MRTIQYILPSSLDEAALSLLPENLAISLSEPLPRRRLRLYLVGTEADTQQTIDHLHVRGCIERIAWNPTAITIPDNGVVIRPDPGDVLRYLQRDRQRSAL